MAGSTGWQHCLVPHTDNIPKPAKWPDYLYDAAERESVTRTHLDDVLPAVLAVDRLDGHHVEAAEQLTHLVHPQLVPAPTDTAVITCNWSL